MEITTFFPSNFTCAAHNEKYFKIGCLSCIWNKEVVVLLQQQKHEGGVP